MKKNIIYVLVGFAASAVLYSAGAHADFSADTSNPDQWAKVTGYDLNGAATCDPLPAGMACPQGGTNLELVDKCLAAGGDTKYCSDCSELCTVPVN